MGRYQTDPIYREQQKARTKANRLPMAQWSASKKASHNIFKRQKNGTHVCLLADKAKMIAPTKEESRTLWALNARQAWHYWLHEKAPDGWVNDYFNAKGEPWFNPRLTNAERYKMRYSMDTQFNMKERMRRQIKKAKTKDGIGDCIRGAINREGKSNKVEQELGYSIDELMAHLQRLFTKGMTVDKLRSGEIHVDHIMPKASYDLTDHDEWVECWSLSNLQPLWALDNLTKSAKILTLV